jgi:hypothetical protein
MILYSVVLRNNEAFVVETRNFYSGIEVVKFCPNPEFEVCVALTRRVLVVPLASYNRALIVTYWRHL